VPGFRRFPTALLFAATLLAGCGLKGPLELPEQPSNMVIRPAPGTPPTDTTQSTGAPATAPATPPAGTTTAPAAPAPEEPEERRPPPDLPRGQRGGVS